jgi:hypothetical protein
MRTESITAVLSAPLRCIPGPRDQFEL